MSNQNRPSHVNIRDAYAQRADDLAGRLAQRLHRGQPPARPPSHPCGTTYESTAKRVNASQNGTRSNETLIRKSPFSRCHKFSGLHRTERCICAANLVNAVSGDSSTSRNVIGVPEETGCVVGGAAQRPPHRTPATRRQQNFDSSATPSLKVEWVESYQSLRAGQWGSHSPLSAACIRGSACNLAVTLCRSGPHSDHFASSFARAGKHPDCSIILLGLVRGSVPAVYRPFQRRSVMVLVADVHRRRAVTAIERCRRVRSTRPNAGQSVCRA